jgi:hypothetical protein
VCGRMWVWFVPAARHQYCSIRHYCKVWVHKGTLRPRSTASTNFGGALLGQLAPCCLSRRGRTPSWKPNTRLIFSAF